MRSSTFIVGQSNDRRTDERRRLDLAERHHTVDGLRRLVRGQTLRQSAVLRSTVKNLPVARTVIMRSVAAFKCPVNAAKLDHMRINLVIWLTAKYMRDL
jgi:hypothetical protein